MIYFIDYEIIQTYSGRMKVSADTQDLAKRTIEEMDPVFLRNLSDSSRQEMKTQINPLSRDVQLSLLAGIEE